MEHEDRRTPMGKSIQSGGKIQKSMESGSCLCLFVKKATTIDIYTHTEKMCEGYTDVLPVLEKIALGK